MIRSITDLVPVRLEKGAELILESVQLLRDENFLADSRNGSSRGLVEVLVHASLLFLETTLHLKKEWFYYPDVTSICIR